MNALKAFWRFLFAPEFELWWSGFFLCRIIQLTARRPDDLWSVLNVVLTVVIFLYCTTRGILFAGKGRA